MRLSIDVYHSSEELEVMKKVQKEGEHLGIGFSECPNVQTV